MPPNPLGNSPLYLILLEYCIQSCSTSLRKFNIPLSRLFLSIISLAELSSVLNSVMFTNLPEFPSPGCLKKSGIWNESLDVAINVIPLSGVHFKSIVNSNTLSSLIYLATTSFFEYLRIINDFHIGILSKSFNLQFLST